LEVRLNHKHRPLRASPLIQIDLDESLSGSDSEESEEDEPRKEDLLSSLLKRNANISNDLSGEQSSKQTKGSGNAPLIWFTSSTLPPNTYLGFYKAIFAKTEVENRDLLVETIRKKQIEASPLLNSFKAVTEPSKVPEAVAKAPHVFLCMIGGGHFAGMIISLAPKLSKGSQGGPAERQAVVVVQKTFHRYTTRRKQGGSQSANDSAKGAAHSAGAGIRRYNEAALIDEVRDLLDQWKGLINTADSLFVRATGTSNRKTIFGPYEGQVIKSNDPRIRSFPFSTRRATQSELMGAFVKLTRVKVSNIDQAALEAAAAKEAASKAASALPKQPKATPEKRSINKDEEERIAHTTKIQSLIRRSKAPDLLAYLTKSSLTPMFNFAPATSRENHHAPTPLHFAASVNAPIIVLALLTKAGANPTSMNEDEKTAFDLAGDRATRDAFRVARSELGEDAWDWDASNVPAPLSKKAADERTQRDKIESDKAEAERRKVEVAKLKDDGGASGKGSGKKASGLDKTAAEKREEESRGMTPEMRQRLERERRARAAEERMKRLQG
jgi:Bacteroidetes VLRF1 release factor